jgi:hypothetical protein
VGHGWRFRFKKAGFMPAFLLTVFLQLEKVNESPAALWVFHCRMAAPFTGFYCLL